MKGVLRAVSTLLLAAMGGGCGGGAAPVPAPARALALTVLTGPTAGSARVPIAGSETVEVAGVAGDLLLDGLPVPFERVDAGTVRFLAPPRPHEMASTVGTADASATLFYTQEFDLDADGEAFTRERARHLLRRAEFGAAPARIDEAVARGLEATVRALLDSGVDGDAEARAMAAYGDGPWPGAHQGPRDNQHWWLELLLRSRVPFRERFALVLHDHFATSERNFEEQARWFLHGQMQLWRRFALAAREGGLGYDWRALLGEVGKDRAMLEWLNGRESTREEPNENYARELWELFMLGEGQGYTERDIRESARALTGFLVFGSRGQGDPDGFWEVRYQPRRHDATEKTILGVRGRFGYDDVAPFYETVVGLPDVIFGETDASVVRDPRDADGGIVALTLRERPLEASRFLARRLCAAFLYPDPPGEICDRIAEEIRDAGWVVRPALERLLRSKAFFSARARESGVSSPVEFAIGFLRQTGLDRGADVATLRDHLARMGQVPFDPPDVSGWPEGDAWLAAQSMVERINLLGRAVAEFGEPILPPEGAPLVDHAASLLGLELSPAARARCEAYVGRRPDVRLKTGGLLYILGQLPEAQRR